MFKKISKPKPYLIARFAAIVIGLSLLGMFVSPEVVALVWTIVLGVMLLCVGVGAVVLVSYLVSIIIVDAAKSFVRIFKKPT